VRGGNFPDGECEGGFALLQGEKFQGNRRGAAKWPRMASRRTRARKARRSINVNVDSRSPASAAIDVDREEIQRPSLLINVLQPKVKRQSKKCAS